MYIEARTLIKIIIAKFKERSSKRAKSDRWSNILGNILIKKKRKVFEK